MKTLSKFVVKVANQAQLNVALKFFLRASRRPLNPSSVGTMCGFKTMYVGMYGRTVNIGPSKFPFETVIDFNDMALLADTPTRYRALDAAGFKPEPRKEIKKALPIVQFDYPKSDTFVRTRRSVRLIQATTRYYVGIEILPDNKFQFKKFLKNKATNVEVLTF
jgi:hypothetical protein